MEKEAAVNHNEMDPSNKDVVHNDEINSRVKRAQRFFDLIKSIYGEKMGERKTINDLINEITPETAIEILEHLNSRLLKDGPAKKNKVAYGTVLERRAISSSSTKGQLEYVAPEESIQKKLFKKYLNVIKELKDPDQRALLAYYGINNLHLFEDGNGRTSRAIYLLIKNNSFLKDEINLVHKCDEDRTGRENFLSKHGVKPVKQVRALAISNLQPKLVHKNYLGGKYSNAYFSIDSTMASFFGLVQLPPEISRNISRLQDNAAISFTLSDGTKGEHHSTIAGLALAMVLHKKGILGKIANENLEEDGRHVSFPVNYVNSSANNKRYQKVHDIFNDWDTEDLGRLISSYRLLKMTENTTLISMFTNNEGKPPR